MKLSFQQIILFMFIHTLKVILAINSARCECLSLRVCVGLKSCYSHYWIKNFSSLSEFHIIQGIAHWILWKLLLQMDGVAFAWLFNIIQWYSSSNKQSATAFRNKIDWFMNENNVQIEFFLWFHRTEWSREKITIIIIFAD